LGDSGLTAAQVAAFGADGYVIVPRLFALEEVDLLSRIGRADPVLNGRAVDRQDAAGGHSRISLTFDLTDDIFSTAARCARVVRPMEQLLGGPVYHYHHKMMMKEPHGGGAWEWHQDYGYWYNGGFLFPTMASCMIAVDRATRENGCLQVLRGSHRLGRLNHGPVGDQTGADPERVAAVADRLELVHATLEPGDALFFHSNTLHKSDTNLSDQPRWCLIACYNRVDNPPCQPGAPAISAATAPEPDARVLAVGRRQIEALGNAAR